MCDTDARSVTVRGMVVMHVYISVSLFRPGSIPNQLDRHCAASGGYAMYHIISSCPTVGG